MRIACFCFILAALAGVTGMLLGLYMGPSEDHSLTPAHAHLNLMGWVTMTLYGLYHRGAPQDVRALRWVQVGPGGFGIPVFTGGPAFCLQAGNENLFGPTVAAALACFAAMVLFLVILIRDARALRPSHAQWRNHMVMSG
jgi:hypothetical protein